MLNRRSLLVGAGTVLLSQLLAGCGGGRGTLQVQLLANSVPAQVLRDFQQLQQTKLSFATAEQLSELFALLQAWQQVQSPTLRLPLPLRQPASPAADVITLGDAWLAAAIQQNLLQPIDPAALSQWQQLPPVWRSFVQRDRQGMLSRGGDVWAAPYRYGTLAIAYRREEFEALGWTPQDWADLWRPELRGHLSLLDSPRAVIGLTLKKLGNSFNETDLSAVPNLERELRSLQEQVKFYSSNAYLQPLLLGDTWAAVGWSTDILPTLERDRRIGAVVPQSGTLLTADLWVRPALPPATAEAEQAGQALANQWIDFCWQPQVAQTLSILSAGASPVAWTGDRTNLPPALRDDPLRLPPADVLDRSEFLVPLDEATAEQYRQVWTAVRQLAARASLLAQMSPGK